jgi:hypothetical protein
MNVEPLLQFAARSFLFETGKAGFKSMDICPTLLTTNYRKRPLSNPVTVFA